LHFIVPTSNGSIPVCSANSVGRRPGKVHILAYSKASYTKKMDLSFSLLLLVIRNGILLTNISASVVLPHTLLGVGCCHHSELVVPFLKTNFKNISLQVILLLLIQILKQLIRRNNQQINVPILSCWTQEVEGLPDFLGFRVPWQLFCGNRYGLSKWS
jgi:hypothetical protein